MRINVRFIFGAVILLMMAFNLGILSFHPIPDSNQNSFTQISGSLQTLAGMVVGYYFATTEASKRKTDVLVDQLNQSKDSIVEDKGTSENPVHVSVKDEN